MNSRILRAALTDKRPYAALRSMRLALIAASVVLVVGCGHRDASYNHANVALTSEKLLEMFPWLSDTSQSWSQEADLSSASIPAYSHLGCFPLGNGRVFTTLGLRYPFGTMSNIFGPVYQKREGSLGAQSVVLIVGGKPYPLPNQRVEWVMRAGMIHTRLSDARGVSLDIYDCVPPGRLAIVRVIVAANNSRRAIKNVVLGTAYLSAALEPRDGLVVSKGSGRVVHAGFVGSRTTAVSRAVVAPLPQAAQKVNRSGAEPVGSTVLCPVGTLRPGQSIAKIAYTVIAPDSDQALREEEALREKGFDVVRENHDWWEEWYSDALSITCPDERINEFIPIQQHIIRVQQAESGGYSPMYMYTTCWVRDSNGPVRFMTQSGKFEEVRKALDYHYACSAQAGKIPMNFPLDIAIREPLPEVDWSKAPTERAEVPSFLILQHYWYWRQSGDMTPIVEHWEYLRRNLLGQQVDQQGRLPFHGDETYRFPGYQIFEQTRTMPTDWVSMDLMSADSAWEYIAAAGAMMRWAQRLGKTDEAREYDILARRVRKALDELYWMGDIGSQQYAPAMSDFSGERYRYPFANISLRPQWLAAPVNWWGVDGAPDRQPDQSALTALRFLWKNSGTVRTTPGCAYYVGMTPGLVLWTLAELNHTSAAQAIRGLLRAASPSGGYSEMNKPDDTPSDKYWGKNRVRPWEGGINAEALIFALTGFRPSEEGQLIELSPRLPFDWDRLSVTNLAYGDGRLGFTVTRDKKRYRATLRWSGGKPITVGIRGATPLELQPEEEVSLDLPELGFTFGQPLKPPDKAFEYGVPTFAGKAKTVLATWSKETFEEYRARYSSLAAIDTKIAFPPEYLAAALYDTKRDIRRADLLILDVDKYPGHCKTSAFWVEGPGRKIIAQFQKLGGRVEKVQNPREKPKDLFGK